MAKRKALRQKEKDSLQKELLCGAAKRKRLMAERKISQQKEKDSKQKEKLTARRKRLTAKFLRY